MRYVAGAILFLAAFLLQLKMIALFRQMIREVNGAPPADSAVARFGPSWIRAGVVAFRSALACVVRFA